MSAAAPTARADRPDEALVACARAGDQGAWTQLVERYEPLIGALVARVSLPGAELDDARQEALVGLVGAVRCFEERVGVPFGAFVTVCMRRQLVTALKRAGADKHRPISYAARLEASGAAGPLGERLAGGVAAGQLAEGRIAAQQLAAALSRRLTTIERRALEAMIGAGGYASGVPVKRADNALQRARRKARALLEDLDAGQARRRARGERLA